MRRERSSLTRAVVGLEDVVRAFGVPGSLLRGNLPEWFGAYATAIKSGFLSVNDCREWEGLSRIEAAMRTATPRQSQLITTLSRSRRRTQHEPRADPHPR